MDDTSGFYKLDPESGELFFAPHFVSAPTFELLRETRVKNTYPVEGWSWFDSEDEARAAHKAPLRARNPDGTFIADDPATPENEAWVTP